MPRRRDADRGKGRGSTGSPIARCRPSMVCVVLGSRIEPCTRLGLHTPAPCTTAVCDHTELGVA